MEHVRPHRICASVLSIFLTLLCLLFLLQHYRNFVGEMPKRGKKLEFEELSAQKIAYQLMGNLKEGDKVAITTRIFSDSVEEIVTALRGRGLRVRVISGQSGVEDFCFLQKAQKELVGMVRSSFVLWAAYLGNAKQVRMYNVDSLFTRNVKEAGGVRRNIFNWTHPEMQRVKYETYKSEELEDMEGNMPTETAA